MSRRIWDIVVNLSVLILLLTGCGTSRANNDVGEASAGNVDFVRLVEAAAQESDPVIRIQPTTQELGQNDLGNVQILIDNITNLYALEIQLTFDPTIIQIQDADPTKEGVQIQQGTFPFPDFVKDNSVNNNTGEILYAITQTSPRPPANGSGTVATITFETILLGQTNIAFTSVKLSDPDGQPLVATEQAGQVFVVEATATPIPGEPTSTPTFTPTPIPVTDTPTPTITVVIPTVTPTPMPTVTTTPMPPAPTNTPLPPQNNIPSGAAIGFCYRVQEGETLASIGQKFGVDPHYLDLVNDLHPPGYVFLHQALFIPEVYGHGPSVYIVREGDTLNLIADQCHLPPRYLAWCNNLSEEATLSPGFALQIPRPPFPPPSRYPYPPPGPPPVAPPPGGPPPGMCPLRGSGW